MFHSLLQSKHNDFWKTVLICYSVCPHWWYVNTAFGIDFGAIMRLRQCQQNNLEEYGQINHIKSPKVLTFYVTNCSEETKTYIQFYVIASHWHDTVTWNPPSSKTRTYLFYTVNIMGNDFLVTQGARASVTMTFTMLKRINSVPAH